MNLTHYARLGLFGLTAILFRRKAPILGTIIVGDRCNLQCAHCAVGNVRHSLAGADQIRRELRLLRERGVRLLFFCGGETTLWQDGATTLDDLIAEAKGLGFFSVQVVTNGTLRTDIPGADLVFLSLDGTEAAHDRIRGPGTWRRVMDNLDRQRRNNVVVYSAINAWNLAEIRPLADFVRRHPALRCLSFKFHTPYHGTEHLALDPAGRRQAVETIRALIREGYPIFNLEVGLDRWLRNDWRRPCAQCLVVEDGRVSTCGRCVHLDGLCRDCGYLFAVEFSLLCAGNLRAIAQMLRTYPRYA
jgi:MoaA/NifB/PqqE/SkfB family radical SAM enzyme